MKKKLGLILTGSFLIAFSQNNQIPKLIPKTIAAKTGYINQKGEMLITPEYHIAMFFAEDCNLLTSPNKKARIFGTANYATVEKNQISYRINTAGKRVYQYKNSDLGKCSSLYTPPKYRAFVLNGSYGLVSKESIDMGGYKDFDIYPQYQMLYVLDGDIENPMIVAVQDNKFGIVDKNNKIILPFIYEDIKTNMSWKTANLFQVSKNGKDYFFVDRNNNTY